MTLQQQIRANRRRTAYVVVAFVVLVVVVAAASSAFLGRSAGIFLVAAGLAYGLFAWWNAGRMIGALTRARPLEKRDDAELYRLLENVSIGAGLPATPPLYLVDDPAPNAFAAGTKPSSAYVGVTTGLRRLMPARELEAVLAHEVSHIRNRDARLMTLAAVLVGVVAMLSDMAFRMAFWGGRSSNRNPLQIVSAIAALILAPLAAMLLQLALSRRREFLADASAAAILNDPEAMALALRRLQLDPTELTHADRATAHLFIESPAHSVRGPGSFLGGLFETHPPLEDRIRALEQAGGFRLPPLPPPSG